MGPTPYNRWALTPQQQCFLFSTRRSSFSFKISIENSKNPTDHTNGTSMFMNLSPLPGWMISGCLILAPDVISFRHQIFIRYRWVSSRSDENWIWIWSLGWMEQRWDGRALCIGKTQTAPSFAVSITTDTHTKAQFLENPTGET